MSKKFFATLIVAVVATFAGYNIYQSQRTFTLSDLALANVEALASDESGNTYETRREDTIEVWDDATETYKKITTIICEGRGSLEC